MGAIMDKTNTCKIKPYTSEETLKTSVRSKFAHHTYVYKFIFLYGLGIGKMHVHTHTILRRFHEEIFYIHH